MSEHDHDPLKDHAATQDLKRRHSLARLHSAEVTYCIVHVNKVEGLVEEGLTKPSTFVSVALEGKVKGFIDVHKLAAG